MRFNICSLLLAITVSVLVEDVLSHGSHGSRRGSEVLKKACSTGVTLTQSSGRILVSGWSRYAANQHCKFTIIGAEGSTLKIRLLKFDVRSWNRDCSRDYARVFDGQTEYGKFCTPGNPPPKIFWSTSNNITMVFHSYQHNFGGNGIYMRWNDEFSEPLLAENVSAKYEDASLPQAGCLSQCDTCPQLTSLLTQRRKCSDCVEKLNEECGGTCEDDVMRMCQKSKLCPQSVEEVQPAAVEENLNVISCRGCVDKCLGRLGVTCGFPDRGWKYMLTPASQNWAQSQAWCRDNFNGELASMHDYTMRLKIMSYLNLPTGPAWVGTTQPAQPTVASDGVASDHPVDGRPWRHIDQVCGALFPLSAAATDDDLCTARHRGVCVQKCY